MFKRLTSVAVLCALLSCFLCVPTSAASLSGTAEVRVFYQGSSDVSWSNVAQSPYSVDFPASDTHLQFVGSRNRKFKLDTVTMPQSGISETLTVVFSYFFQSTLSISNTSPDNPYFYASYLDSQGSLSTVDGSVSVFTPVKDFYFATSGLTCSVDVPGTELEPLNSLVLHPFGLYADTTGNTTTAATTELVFTSFRAISTSAPSADLEELKNIAAGIAQSNQILSAMYGDILAVCNSIYERNGSILEAQQLTNQYFQAIIPLLNNISSTTSNIYSLLSAQFSLLISTIQSESDDIQSAIDAAVDKMIAYLDNVFENSVNPSLPGQSSDISSGTTTIEDSESGYQSTASERFDAISAEFTGFSGGVLDGVALAGNLFQRLWNVLGAYNVVYTVPLTLAIILTILGRLDRRAKKDDGSESHSSDPPNVPRLPK